MTRSVFLSLLFIVSQASAQVASSINLTYARESNVLGNYAEIPDDYLSADFYLDDFTGWDYSSLDVSYDGTLSSYNSFPEQDNWVHNFAAEYRIQLTRPDADSVPAEDSDQSGGSDSLQTFLTLGGLITRTLPHSGEFQLYQNFVSGGSAFLRLPVGRSAVLRFGYVVNYTGFDFLPPLSSLKNVGSVNFSVPAGSGATIYVGGGLGNEMYYGVDTSGTGVQKLIKMHGNSGYKGKGKGGAPNPTTSSSTFLLTSPSVTQLTYGGGAVIVSGRWSADAAIMFSSNLTGDARYIDAVARFAGEASAVYDDPYSYHGGELKLAGKKDSLINAVNVALEFTGAVKNYARPAYDYTQTIELADHRRDRYSRTSVTLSRVFRVSGFSNDFTLSLTYSHLSNSSNDQYYNFFDDIFAASLTVNLL